MPASSPGRVLVVGLGTIARTHLGVLDRLPDVAVVGGVDPVPRPDLPFPVFGDLATALATAGAPDVVVVASPTDTHGAVVEDVLTRTGALVLCEKPLARTAAAIAELESRHSAGVVAQRVKVAHHFAFSPEVEWAVSHVRANPDWGPPTRVHSVFNDAYGALSAERRSSLVSSWVDSGPNQLSIVGAFVEELRLVSHASRGDRAVTTLEHAGGHTHLSSNWLAGDTSKQTTLEFRGGAAQVRMDHTSMTATVLTGGRITEHVAYVGSVGRKDAHYLGLYDALLGRPDDPRLGVPLASAVAELLEQAELLPQAEVTWSSVTA